jgi:hypothetical protein
VNAQWHLLLQCQEKNYELPIVYAGEYAAYLSNEQTVTEQLNLRYGLRLSAFQNMGQNQPLYTSLYLQLANNSSAGSPLDIWFPAGNKIKPQKVNLYLAGYFHNLNDNQYETSCEPGKNLSGSFR